MDSIIRETVKAVGLQSVLDSSVLESSFINYAVMIWARGKSGAIANASQLPFFSIHLACLKNAVTLDAVYLQKKSTLIPKAYQSGLQALLQVVNPEEVINAENVAKYYGCPSLALLITNLQASSKDFSSSAVLAAVLLIGQKTKLSKTFGTLAELSLLWAVPLDHLKSASSALKPFLESSGPNDWKEQEKLLTGELKESQRLKSAQLRAASQRPSATAAKRSLNSSPVKKSASNTHILHPQSSSASIHPLLLFNCSSSGPAFGPLIYQ